MDARPYFASTPWPVLEQINSALCQTGGYQVGRTSDGYLPARDLWEESRQAPLTVVDAAKLCRRCHTLSPFLFLNGNTFVSCVRIALGPAWEVLPANRAASLRAAVGHYVAGTISDDELRTILERNQ